MPYGERILGAGWGETHHMCLNFASRLGLGRVGHPSIVAHVFGAEPVTRTGSVSGPSPIAASNASSGSVSGSMRTMSTRRRLCQLARPRWRGSGLGQTSRGGGSTHERDQNLAVGRWMHASCRKQCKGACDPLLLLTEMHCVRLVFLHFASAASLGALVNQKEPEGTRRA